MEKACFTAITLMILALGVSTIAVAEQIDCTGIDIPFLKKHLPFTPDEVVELKALPEAGMCQVVFSLQGQKGVAYVPQSRLYVMAGELFMNKTAMAEKVIADIDYRNTRKYEKDLADIVSATYKPKNPRTYLYMFTDPDCPYCQRAKEPLKQFADENGVEIRVVFMPLPMHPDAKNKSIAAVCNKKDFTAYLNNDYSGTACPEGEAKITKAIEIARKLGVNGTPTFIGPSGKRVGGFDTDQIKEML
jgi:thiol:disulfide interchange protein DsbC